MHATLSHIKKPPIDFVLSDARTEVERGHGEQQVRRYFLRTALCFAALANGLVPAALFSNTEIFGHIEPWHRFLVTLFVVIEYAIALFVLHLRANVGFASGYVVGSAAIVTVVSSLLAFLTVHTASWTWRAIHAQSFALGWFAIVFFANLVFFVASVRYARAIHPRIHLGGFSLGIATSVALVLTYLWILP